MEPSHAAFSLALLVELGSERSVDAVKQVLESKGDYERFAMAVTMLMSVAGPKGRDAVIMAKTDHLDAENFSARSVRRCSCCRINRNSLSGSAWGIPASRQ